MIFLGALLIILSFLIFLHWLAQFYLDNQERDDSEDILDSDEEQYASSYEQHLKEEKNKSRFKKFNQKVRQKRNFDNKRPSFPTIEKLKAGSDGSTVSDKSVKIRTKNRLAVSLSVKHSNLDMRLSGMIKGVTGLQFPDHGGPDKIRFKLNLRPKKRKKSFKTSLHIPLEASLLIPFQFRLIRKTELSDTVLHLRLYGKKERFGLPIGPEHCYGEAFISLSDLATKVDEINIVQEIIPLGSKPFNRKSINIRVASPKITTREVKSQQLEVSKNDFSIPMQTATDFESREDISAISAISASNETLEETSRETVEGTETPNENFNEEVKDS